jgi:hypothetical protein
MKNLILSVIFSVISQSQANASFIESWMRYPPPHGIAFLIKQQFPNSQNYNFCTKITKGNKGLLGVSSTLDGKPASANPSVSFQLWYLDCLKNFANIEFTVILQKTYQPSTSMTAFQDSSRYYGQFAGAKALELESGKITDAEKTALPANVPWFTRVLWSDVTPTDKATIVSSVIRAHLGPESSYQYLGVGRSERQLTSLLLKAVDAALTDASELNIAFLKGLEIDSQKPTLASVIKLTKVLTLSLDEFLLE